MVNRFALKCLLISGLLGLSLGLLIWWLVCESANYQLHFATHPNQKILTTQAGENAYYKLETPQETYYLNLISPETAPKEIHDKVMLGYRIMVETGTYAGEYRGNRLCCINCHFQGGNTFGGKNGSISLVGSSGWYPSYSERSGTTLELSDRINNCFQRSLNGRPLPKNSPQMEGLLAYLNWISQDVEHLKNKTPWRGLRPLKTAHKADTTKGEKLYNEKCATCHGIDGSGSFHHDDALSLPSLWGDDSFNDGAGMNRLPTFASFIYTNMPYGQPSLTEDEAVDIAAYVTTKPRPKFDPHKYDKQRKNR